MRVAFLGGGTGGHLVPGAAGWLVDGAAPAIVGALAGAETGCAAAAGGVTGAETASGTDGAGATCSTCPIWSLRGSSPGFSAISSFQRVLLPRHSAAMSSSVSPLATTCVPAWALGVAPAAGLSAEASRAACSPLAADCGCPADRRPG